VARAGQPRQRSALFFAVNRRTRRRRHRRGELPAHRSPANGSIEVGHINFSPPLQRTTGPRPSRCTS
jgi:hypothetical protein